MSSAEAPATQPTDGADGSAKRPGADAALELTLLGTADCSLCETFTLALQAWAEAQHRPVRIDIIDICDDPELETRYGWHIPVLLAGQRQLCSGHFDAAGLRDILS